MSHHFKYESAFPSDTTARCDTTLQADTLSASCLPLRYELPAIADRDWNRIDDGDAPKDSFKSSDWGK